MLIIVESPAKAKTISKIVGKNYTVKASVGHIRRISDNKKTADGRVLEINGIDIDRDFQPIFEVDEDKEKVVKELKKLAKAAKDGILFATDEDREGEAISWHLAEILKIDPTKVRRLVFHEITKSAILKAIEQPRNLNIELVTAQQARQVLDKLVGYKLSPVLWTVMRNNHLSAGRVQSPALRLICDREKEILSFIPQEYWEIYGKFINFSEQNPQPKTTLLLNEDENRAELRKEIEKDDYLKFSLSRGQKLPKVINSQDEVKKLVSGCLEDSKFIVTSVSTKEEYSRTKPPFITSTLQQAASSKLGFTPKMTMRLAQKLYEGVMIDGEPVALITYMRTDSFNLSTESITAAREFIGQKYPKFLPKEAKFYKSKSRNAQEAHEAIRPIDPSLSPEKLKGKLENSELKLYDLIWKQMVASQMTDEIRQRFSFELENSLQDRFSGSVAWTIHAGFKAMWGETEVDPKEASLKIQKDQEFSLQDLIEMQSFTKPPSRYSPASLIKKLEELGIGRPSTYASIISTLTDRSYAEIKNNIIYPSTLGMKVSDLLSDNFTQVTGSELTAKMEEELDQISRGEKQYTQVLTDFWQDFKQEVESKKAALDEDKSKYRSSKSDVPCPKCSSEMELKLGRFGEYFQCLAQKEHQFPKNFRELELATKLAIEKFSSQAEGKKCQECGKNLIVRVSKSTLNPYIACPDYKVGNKHTVLPVNFGSCPECQKAGRDGVLVQKSFRGRKYIACNLPKEKCGYVQKNNNEN